MALTAVLSLYSQRSYGAEFEQLLSGSLAPLTVKLKDLDSTIGSLNNIRPFNLKEELAASERAYQDAICASQQRFAIAAYEKTQLESLNTQVSYNLTTLGSALLKYAEEHNEVLPQMKNSASVESTLKDWVEDQSAFVHPKTSEPFQFNSSLSGKKLADIPNAEQVVAFYEASPAKDGSRGVVFLDGRTERISSAEWSKVKQESGLP